MDQEKIHRYTVVVLIIVVGMIWLAVWSVADTKLHVVLCNVGQGDAILITRGNVQMVVDGGPDDRVMECLAKYMPWYDHKIEIVQMTHPQADHMTGLIGILRNYKVDNFVTVEADNNTQTYRQLVQALKTCNCQVSYVVAGNKLSLGEIAFDVIWPSAESVTNFKPGMDLNGVAIVGKLTYGNFSMLFTGDADASVDPAMVASGLLSHVDVLKVPHHGSKTGMTQTWLTAVDPKIAIISVGKNNKYGHPSEQAIKLLKELDSNILRTDLDGDVEVVSDGLTYRAYSRKM